MDVYLYSPTGIEAVPGGENEGINNNRIRFHQEGSMVSVWLTRDQAEEVRRAVDVLYPMEGVLDTPPTLDPAAEEALAAYADTHAGDDKSCPVEGEVTVGQGKRESNRVLAAQYAQLLADHPAGGYLCPSPSCGTTNLARNDGFCPACGADLFPVYCYTTKEEATV